MDGSKHSEKALVYSLEEAKELGNEITALNVVRSVRYDLDETKSVVSERVKSAEDYMDGIKDKSREYGLEIDTQVITGEDVHNEIVRYAAENNFDLIVMGGKGRSDLGTIHLGNVSESVVRRAHCPVLIVR